MNLDSATAKQREYYAATAESYDDMHIAENDEHTKALSLFAGMAAQHPHGRILDVGAGTGRAIRFLNGIFPDSNVIGIEPVAELREAGIRAGGLTSDQLIDGDVTALEFEDDAFDWVMATGVLHHVKDFRQAVREMVRVARVGILISDSNNIGQGGRAARLLKRTIKGLGLWNALTFVQTKGKGYKWSEEDGVFYSFCAFDCVPIIQQKFTELHYCNTQPAGFDLYGSAPHVAILAYADSQN